MVSVSEFLSAFHQSQQDTVHLRAFHDQEKTDAKNFTVMMDNLTGLMDELKNINRQKFGIFHVVNSGGHTDADITRINAQFFERDTGTFEEQLAAIADFPLRPSIIVKTKKSLHTYYLVKDADVARFRTIQKQLVARFNGDGACVNESRVMRIPGFYHQKQDPVLVECIEWHPQLIYTQDEISSHLPAIVESERNTTSAAVSGDNKGLEIACSKCLFLQHCQEHPEELSEFEWYAMITNLAPFKGGRDRTHTYSHPYPKYSERETDEKIKHFFTSGTAPINCATIAERGWRCPQLGGACGCKSPSGLACQPLDSEELQGFLNRYSKLEGSGMYVRNYERAKEFTEEFFINVPFDICERFISENLMQHFGLKQRDVKNLTRSFKERLRQHGPQEYVIDYDTPLQELLSAVRGRFINADSRIAAVCMHTYNWLEHNRAAFFRYGDASCAVQLGNQLCIIGNTRNFTSFIYDITGIVPSSLEGRAVMQTMGDRAFKEGHRVQQAKWLMYNLRSEMLYLNLCNDENQILRISAGEAIPMPNGINPDKVLLADTTTKMEPIVYRSKESMIPGLYLFKEHVVDHFTCDPMNRLMLACIVIAMFLKDLSASKPILKFSGSTATGKSTAAKLVSTLVYGKDSLQAPTVAAMYSAASQDPLVILDNLETEDLSRDGKQFLLTAATGITKKKRDGSTNTGVIEESVDAMIIVTAIEPFVKNELINRTYDFEFSESFKQPAFMERNAIRTVMKNRDDILSGIFNLLAYHVMPDLEFLRKEAIEILDMNPHSKSRTNDFLTIVMAVLIKLLEVVPEISPHGAPVNKIVEAWLDYQTSKAESTEAGTDVILLFLDALLRDLQAEDGEKRSEKYNLRLIKEKNKIIGWECTTSAMLIAFTTMSKNISLPFKYQTSSQLGQRFMGLEKLLDENGWSRQKTSQQQHEGKQPYTYIKRG